MSGRPGDPVQLGDELGHPMEPGKLHARVVGILHKRDRIVIRQYRTDDRIGIPTGDHRITWMAVAYEGLRK